MKLSKKLSKLHAEDVMTDNRQKDKATKKAKAHGTWRGTHRAQRKFRARVIKNRHRALRREGKLEAKASISDLYHQTKKTP